MFTLRGQHGKRTLSDCREENGADWNAYELLFLERLVRTAIAQTIWEKWQMNDECKRRKMSKIEGRIKKEEAKV
jgi:hypothetical protein